MPGETPNPELITHVPSAEELAHQYSVDSGGLEDDAYSMDAFRAVQAGEQGTAAELNQKYPLRPPEGQKPYVPPTRSEAPINPVEYEDDPMDHAISREELARLREQLRQEGKL